MYSNCPGSGIAPFFPIPTQSSGIYLPFHLFLLLIRLPILFTATLSYFFVLQWLPIGSLGKKASLWLILGAPGVWWIDLQIDGVKKGCVLYIRYSGYIADHVAPALSPNTTRHDCRNQAPLLPVPIPPRLTLCTSPPSSILSLRPHTHQPVLCIAFHCSMPCFAPSNIQDLNRRRMKNLQICRPSYSSTQAKLSWSTLSARRPMGEASSHSAHHFSRHLLKPRSSR